MDRRERVELGVGGDLGVGLGGALQRQLVNQAGGEAEAVGDQLPEAVVGGLRRGAGAE